MFTTGFSMEPEKLSESVNGPSTQWLEAKAQELNTAITGSLIIKDGDRYYNRLVWAESGGELRHYDKRHLFRMAKEHNHYSPGGIVALSVEWRGFRICPLVCYDLRFPVYSRRRPGLEYDLLIYVASWPAARRTAWRALLKARAIENQAF